MTAQKMVPAGTEIAIYGEPANINYFLNTDLTPVSQTGAVDKQASVKAHTRRKYAGDSAPSNVSAATREYLYDPGRRNGAATPGKPFILDDGTEKRAFSYTGSFMNLHAFIKGDASMDLTLYSQSAAYAITASEAG